MENKRQSISYVQEIHAKPNGRSMGETIFRG